MTIRTAGNRWLIACLEDQEQAIEFAVHHFLDAAEQSIQLRGQFTVALSGGSTPKAIYQKLSSPPYRDAIDWSRVLLFWGDERAVPPDHPDSNYKMAMDAGFKTLPIKEEHIFRMQAESDLEVHAANYEHLIREKAGGVFDLVMLGMGDDGHTASLFPDTAALKIEQSLVVPNFVPKLDAWRMTLTFPCINMARHIALYVMGEKKADRFAEVIRGVDAPLKFPIQKVGTPANSALWITDINL